MNHSRLHFFLFSLMSLVATAVYAVEQLPEKEEDIPVEFIPTLDTTISVGMRRFNNGPRVRFGNLGSIAQPTTGDTQDVGSSFVTHSYTDGYVVADSLSDYEKTASGTALASGETYTGTGWISTNVGGIITVYTAISTAMYENGSLVTNSNGTYVANTTPVNNSDGTVTQTNSLTWASTYKFIAYDANHARTWAVLNQSQIFVDTDGSSKVRMNADGVVSAGASLEADATGNTGFEISYERRLGKRGHLEWGVTAGCEFAYINAKAAGVFPAYLLRTTDIYTLYTAYNGGLTGSSIDRTQSTGDASDLTYTTLDGSTVYKYTSASTTPTSVSTSGDASTATPIDLTSVQWGTAAVVGTVMIHGNYQLKGAYLLSRFGPSIRYNFNDRWAVSSTFGLALAWVGTTFRATEYYNTWYDLPESLRPDDIANATEYHVTESNATHKFTPGIYYDLNLEYWVTERTGFYYGITGQSIRGYNQSKLSGRTATVDMGKSAGWTLGIRTRF